MGFFDTNPLQVFVDKLAERSNLGDAERDALLALPAHPAQVQTNRDFVRFGERVQHATFIVAGLVGRFSQNREGNRQITAVHIPSDMANLNSVVTPNACAALQALSVTTILRVPHAALREAAQRFPAIGEAFWRECAVDSAVLAEWVVNVGRRDAKSRLAHLLCEVASRMKQFGQNGSAILFPATQTHMADMAGLTPVHVNRSLQALRSEQIVDVGRREFSVLDWERLADVADFDPAYLRIGPQEVPAG